MKLTLEIRVKFVVRGVFWVGSEVTARINDADVVRQRRSEVSRAWWIGLSKWIVGRLARRGELVEGLVWPIGFGEGGMFERRARWSRLWVADWKPRDRRRRLDGAAAGVRRAEAGRLVRESAGDRRIEALRESRPLPGESPHKAGRRGGQGVMAVISGRLRAEAGGLKLKATVWPAAAGVKKRGLLV